MPYQSILAKLCAADCQFALLLRRDRKGAVVPAKKGSQKETSATSPF